MNEVYLFRDGELLDSIFEVNGGVCIMAAEEAGTSGINAWKWFVGENPA